MGIPMVVGAEVFAAARDELTEAHKEILGQREHLQAAARCTRGNTKVISQFTEIQEEILRAMQSRVRTGRSLRRQGDLVEGFFAVGQGEGGGEDGPVMAGEGAHREKA